MKKYWNDKPDFEIDTDKNVLSYYKSAGKLQVSMPSWEDKDGQLKPGKTVTVDLQAIAETPEAVELIRIIVDNME